MKNFSLEKISLMYEEYFETLLKVHNGENGFYEIEEIINHKVENINRIKKQVMLEIKWKGYEEKTWEKFVGFARDAP